MRRYAVTHTLGLDLNTSKKFRVLSSIMQTAVTGYCVAQPSVSGAKPLLYGHRQTIKNKKERIVIEQFNWSACR